MYGVLRSAEVHREALGLTGTRNCRIRWQGDDDETLGDLNNFSHLNIACIFQIIQLNDLFHWHSETSSDCRQRVARANLIEIPVGVWQRRRSGCRGRRLDWRQRVKREIAAPATCCDRNDGSGDRKRPRLSSKCCIRWFLHMCEMSSTENSTSLAP